MTNSIPQQPRRRRVDIGHRSDLARRFSAALDQFTAAYTRPPSANLQPSAVLVLVGFDPASPTGHARTGLLLTKRSQLMRQPGDLCFPGGGIETVSDGILSKLLALPGMPLRKWPHWPKLKKHQPKTMRFINRLLATGLRESFEEIGLLPFAVNFLGSLPPQRLVMFKRVIFPMVGQITWQQRFRINWEVERLVFIPFETLLNPALYAYYRITYDTHLSDHYSRPGGDFPCFVHRFGGPNQEVLWGATYRIVMALMAAVFRFQPPPPDHLPVVERVLSSTYLTGRPANTPSPAQTPPAAKH
jgi:8-oxo-dGTP pyrophosphatase MutT (NUDIX family)